MFSLIIQKGLIIGPVNSPVARNTTLGWILACSASNSNVKSHRIASQNVCNQLNVSPPNNLKNHTVFSHSANLKSNLDELNCTISSFGN